MSLFWVWSGCDLGGHSMFYFLCFGISLFWPGMVLNQGQLSIVVSDWEPYIGSPFPSFLCGKLTLFVALSPVERHGCFLVFFSCFTLTTLHLGHLLQTPVTVMGGHNSGLSCRSIIIRIDMTEPCQWGIV